MKIGVLALQGSFYEHIQMLHKAGAEGIKVRLPKDLENIDGLIIPGGESTTIAKLAIKYGLMDPLRQFAEERAVWGTCAGMVFMAKDVGRDQPLLGIMDIVVKRNAFGSQINSFEADLNVSILNNGNTIPFPGIFIRAPELLEAEENVKIIARLTDRTAVAALQNKWLATSFHPELTNDIRFHQYFLGLI